MCNYYTKFIKEFAATTIPLKKLLRKDVAFNFDYLCMEAFEKIKNITTSPEILRFPNIEEEFILKADISELARGAILSNFDDKSIANICKQQIK